MVSGGHRLIVSLTIRVIVLDVCHQALYSCLSMKIMKFGHVASLSLLLGGCGILYTDVKLPRGYRSATPSEVKGTPEDPVVSGKACTRSALFLVAWGDSSYASAVKDALGTRDGILYDVRADMKVNSYVIGLYTKVCTVITGKVAKS